ncbi:MAG: hypothetical protein ABII90_03675 [Bacteroidota bacterium]
MNKTEILRMINLSENYYKKFMRVSDSDKYYPINPLNLDLSKYEPYSPAVYDNLIENTRNNIMQLVRISLDNDNQRIVVMAFKQWWKDRAQFKQYDALTSCEKQDKEEITAIFDFVREMIRYTKDPIARELVHECITTLFFAGGDCDDMDVVLISLLANAGHDFQVVLAGNVTNGETLHSHIFVTALIQNSVAEYIPFYLDATNKVDGAGWLPEFDVYDVIFDSRIDEL